MTTTTNTTIEDWVETALELLYAHSTTPWSASAYWDEWTRRKPREAMRRALLGVIEKHVGPMLVEAIEAHHTATIRCQALTDGPCDCMTPQDRATRILSDLTTGRET